jgi:hypothetical protein
MDTFNAAPSDSAPTNSEATDRLLARCFEMFQASGLSTLAAGISTAAQVLAGPPPPRPVVVVVGETNRGKSSLVNALLERPALTPTDYLVTTCVPVQFNPAAPGHERAIVHYDDGPAAQEIALDAIADYAAETNNPANAKRVAAVQAWVASRALDQLGVSVVDTPGVGGLDARHADLALAQLRSCDAVIVVLDATQGELNRAELAFIESAAARLSVVIIAVTHVDLVPVSEELARLLQLDRGLIRDRVPALADVPLVPFSSTALDRAFSMPPGDRRDELRRVNGLTPLLETIKAQVDPQRAVELRMANAVRLCHAGLEVLLRQLTIEVDAATADPVAEAALESKQRQVDDLVKNRESWRSALSVKVADIGRNRIEVTLAEQLDRLKSRYQSAADDVTRAEQFQELATRLENEATRACLEATQGIEADVYAGLQAALADIDTEGLLTFGDTGHIEADHFAGGRRQKTFIEHWKALAPAFGISGIANAATAIGLHATGTVTTGGVGVVAAIPFVVLAAKNVRLLDRRAEFKSWVETYLKAARESTQRACRQKIAEATGDNVVRKAEALIDDAIARTQGTVEAVREAQQQGQKRRQQLIESTTRQLTDATTVRDEADALLARLAGVPPFTTANV